MKKTVVSLQTIEIKPVSSNLPEEISVNLRIRQIISRNVGDETHPFVNIVQMGILDNIFS